MRPEDLMPTPDGRSRAQDGVEPSGVIRVPPPAPRVIPTDQPPPSPPSEKSDGDFELFQGHKEHGDSSYVGNAWCFIGIELHTKLVLAFELGKRTETSANRFMAKLATAPHPDVPYQLTTDGPSAYPSAVYKHLGDRVDYAQYIKNYGETAEGQRRYSPTKILSAETKDICGDPESHRICTSQIERQNGSLRQRCKRLTRLTYAFSKKWDSLKSAPALHFAFYNFCRIHRTIRCTPAMAAGLTGHAWKLVDLLAD